MVLRVAYSHVQMVLYRPFLHHAIRRPSDSARDVRSYACASACIKAAKQVIELLKEMYIQDFLNGPDWFFTYITYFAVMSLVTFVLNNPDDASAHGCTAIAESGRQILSSLGVRGSIANRCAASLTVRLGQPALTVYYSTLTCNSPSLTSYLRDAKPGTVYHRPHYFAHRPIIVF